MRERQRQIPLSREMLNLQVSAFWPPVVFFAGGARQVADARRDEPVGKPVRRHVRDVVALFVGVALPRRAAS